MKFPALARQRGITLVVALVMLVLITMLALSTFNLGKSSIQVVGNMQNRNEGIASSDQTLNEAISRATFTTTPLNALEAPCDGVPNTRCFDLNGDGKVDVRTRLTPSPACIKARSIKNTELDLTKEDDRNCIVGSPGNWGQVGGATGNSQCADTTWELNAVSTDQVAETNVTVVMGVSLRANKDDVDTNCP